ncbi:phthiocerol/phthiodiolone dimycocerosyl transferase family protein [Mucilaginibacter sp. SP1R1]|uniref:phthiocerol/phthiodiolone dimycocerosyl transferase family protein n=1 Tax=Mucilaginibacter sp. SP1R1 TaxID=2723091 RepID=UPI001607CF95|nr:condensation domain-containing protein [Mucilaginibacter sp. SP1R1]MBB6149023.1 NRPS condensation-like uncharacterized protein [Mucilaginibacter sp. SP1R1]
MKRKLMMVERIMYVDAHTPLNCVFTAKIQGCINPDNLNAALIKIQKKHPLLRVYIDNEEEGGPYFITNDRICKIPVRIVERFTDQDWLKESQTEWYRDFNDENKPLARVVWLKSASVSELLLVLPHCICDGTTLVNLMREILSLVDNPQQELETYFSFNSVQELMPATFNANKKVIKAKIFSLIGKLFFLFKSTETQFNSGSDYVLHWKLDQEQTIAIAEACKRAGTSVHAALCVAFIKAFEQVKGNKAHEKVISPADIRRFIPEIKQDTMFAFAPIAELVIGKNTAAGFWELARKVKTDLTNKIEAMNVYEMLWMGEYMHHSVNKMVKFLKATNGTHDITLSNMGRISIPKTYQSFELETVYSPTVAFPWRNPNTLITTTFKNQMDFTLMSNNTFLNKTEASMIRDKAIEYLLANIPQLTHA